MLKTLESSQVANMEFERKQNSGQLLQRLLEADKILRYKIQSDEKYNINCIMNIQRREPDRQINNLREAAGILKLEAAGSPYGHLAATVQHNIADLSQYIESVKNM